MTDAAGTPPPNRGHVVPEPILLSIGDIVVSFSMLEEGLRLLITLLLRLDERMGRVLLNEASFRQLRAIAYGAYQELFGKDDDYQALRDILLRSARAETLRNQIVHSTWGARPRLVEGKSLLVRMKDSVREGRGLTSQDEDVDQARLLEIAAEFHALTNEVWVFPFTLASKGKSEMLLQGWTVAEPEDSASS